jgi:hypothetical protein
MIIELTSDELLLAMIGLVRAINPAMLVAEGDGFTFDFTPLVEKKALSADEQLLAKLRAAAQSRDGSLNVAEDEARRLATALERLERMKDWPADVVDMSRALRSKLATAV